MIDFLYPLETEIPPIKSIETTKHGAKPLSRNARGKMNRIVPQIGETKM